ncbi:MAG: hypothetical protein NTZ13_01005 [Candidatus Parcubacteria bacterium]|nr:hypothetical protein [Candidatus Parcubacteria bacterium]
MNDREMVKNVGIGILLFLGMVGIFNPEKGGHLLVLLGEYKDTILTCGLIVFFAGCLIRGLYIYGKLSREERKERFVYLVLLLISSAIALTLLIVPFFF